ncbi:ribbon-helix-helix protein, CopG family [Halalkalicoccus subterraneus]|uniref:ribbon-helix-helix protein, CopG family n=1 Tax=Halalkalicoccus subterraneus TaxID=2675002 RepID=UPI000EFC870B|nr:ribbon-helix-helix protein, CopG family [Halalkalicoccus subterraneus]
MEPVTIRIPDDTYRTLAEEADESGRSMSEVVRERVERGMDYEEIKRERDRLRSEKRTLIQDREERTDLVEYVEQERELQARREERKDAPVWRRAKWWVFGRDRGDRED